MVTLFAGIPFSKKPFYCSEMLLMLRGQNPRRIPSSDVNSVEENFLRPLLGLWDIFEQMEPI